MRKRRRGGAGRRRRYGPSRTRPVSAVRPPVVTTVRGSRDPGRLGRVLLVLMWAGISLAPIPISVPNIQLAAGVVGTPGTLTVDACERLGRGRYDCDGTFLPDDGGRAIPVSAPPDLEAGDRIRAQLTSEGDRAVQAGTSGVIGALTLPALSIGLIAFLPYVILYWTPAATRRHLRMAVIAGCVLTAVSVVSVTAGLIAIYSA